MKTYKLLFLALVMIVNCTDEISVETDGRAPKTDGNLTEFNVMDQANDFDENSGDAIKLCEPDGYFCNFDDNIYICKWNGSTIIEYLSCTENNYAGIRYKCGTCSGVLVPKCIQNKPHIIGSMIKPNALNYEAVDNCTSKASAYAKFASSSFTHEARPYGTQSYEKISLVYPGTVVSGKKYSLSEWIIHYSNKTILCDDGTPTSKNLGNIKVVFSGTTIGSSFSIGLIGKIQCKSAIVDFEYTASGLVNR